VTEVATGAPRSQTDPPPCRPVPPDDQHCGRTVQEPETVPVREVQFSSTFGCAETMIEVLSSGNIESPFVDSITHGVTTGNGRVTRPAETNCHIVISKRHTQRTKCHAASGYHAPFGTAV
jgi:hypothetical protein